jgi:hypothetical protein
MSRRGDAQRAAASRRPRPRRSEGEPPRRRSCGCLQAHFALLDRYPEARAKQAEIESYTRAAREGRAALRRGVIRIPVVVHVVLRRPALVTDAQVRRQIERLNLDFRMKNPDRAKVPAAFRPLAADAKVEFALARKTPAGKATSGIRRKQTSKASFSHVRDDVKDPARGGAAAWDPRRYLNFWVCVLEGGTLGYGQFPGGPEATDGVVILHTAFGSGGSATAPFDLGRTATHEVGHYLNLSHIWGESRIPSCQDDDFVQDTPPQFDKNYGTPSFPHVSCNNGPHGDLFMNYMDYVDDEAMFMFTRGQVARMRATLSGPRRELGT